MKILKLIIWIIYILIGMAIFVILTFPTILFTLPCAIKHIVSGENMYNQTGWIRKLASPFLFMHKLFCKVLFNEEPNRKNYNYYENI